MPTDQPTRQMTQAAQTQSRFLRLKCRHTRTRSAAQQIQLARTLTKLRGVSRKAVAGQALAWKTTQALMSDQRHLQATTVTHLAERPRHLVQDQRMKTVRHTTLLHTS